MKTKHKHPIAAVYMLTNIINNKIYIGETSDWLNRVSTHRCTPRRKSKYINTPIEKAIVKYGFDSFTTTLLESSNKDSNINDTKYRRKLESKYIRDYDSTNPDIGYNRIENNQTNKYSNGGHTYGIKSTIETKLKLSKWILAYDIATESVMLYFGAQSYVDQNDLTDKSMVTSATKLGKILHNTLFYKLDYQERLKDAIFILNKKAMHMKNKPRKSVEKSILNYIKGIEEVNDWCKRFGYKQIVIHDILSTCNLEYLL